MPRDPIPRRWFEVSPGRHGAERVEARRPRSPSRRPEGSARGPSVSRLVRLGSRVLLLSAWAWLGDVAMAQGGRPAGRAAPFTVPVYDRDNPNRLVALLSGSLAEFQLSGRQPLATVRVEYYDEKGQTNLVFQGTNCVYDARARTAESPSALRVTTGDGRLNLEGEGFTWWQTNNDLVISNRVQTRVRRPAASGGPPDSPGGQDLRVTSERFRFNYASNLIVYSGNVRIEDPRIQMQCGRLALRRSAAGGIERMEANEDVVMVDRLSGGQAHARTALYQADAERETVELFGNPRFQAGVRQGTADRFVLDRRSNTLRALGDARLIFPVGSQGAPGLLSLPGAALQPVEGDTNHLVELSAARITILLPETNGPIRSLVAETNVVVLDRKQNGRATAQRASYHDDTGFELSGSPVWSADGQSLRGEVMRYDLAQQAFVVTGGVTARLPVRSLAGPLRELSGAMARTNLAIGSNHVVEIRSRALTYREPWLRFEGETQADYLEDQRKLGELRCAALAIQYSNRVQQAQASGGVRLEQLPTPTKGGGTTAKAVTSETLNAGFDAGGQLETFAATGGVDARQTDTRTEGRPLVIKRLQCETLEARFHGASHIVETATAERRVVVSQDERMAQADRAVYTGTNGLLSLVGHPIVILPEGRITEADSITWNRLTGLYRIAGRFKSQWKSLPGGTNLPTLPRIP